nr:MAG TPA: hypothetical protein [Caudoviricetes sp.]
MCLRVYIQLQITQTRGRQAMPRLFCRAMCHYFYKSTSEK